MNDGIMKSGNRTGNRTIEVIDIDSREYPVRLRNIPDPPQRLYCSGRLELLYRRSVALVGSRKTTQYGRNTAREFAYKLAKRGICIVSGMAAGIDTCAHEGALKCDGDTVAVFGCGPDICYPLINRRLMETIEDKGLIVSEYPPGTEARRYQFPMRNRIITGLSEEVIVVQAGLKSGAALSAEHAVNQGRDVYAVPGNIDSQYNLGSNKLFQDGAGVLLSSGDLLEKLGLSVLTEEEVARVFSRDEKNI